MPSPQAWDGRTTIAKLVRAVKAAGPSLILGVHTRVYFLRPFEYMDHRSLSASLGACSLLHPQCIPTAYPLGDSSLLVNNGHQS